MIYQFDIVVRKLIPCTACIFTSYGEAYFLVACIEIHIGYEHFFELRGSAVKIEHRSVSRTIFIYLAGSLVRSRAEAKVYIIVHNTTMRKGILYKLASTISI